MRQAALTLATFVVVLVVVGCTQPVMRSMRIEPGLELVGGAALLAGEGDASSTSGGAGESTTTSGAVTFWPINVDARYAWVDRLGVGVAGGVYFPGWFNQKINGAGSSCLPPLWMIVPYVQAGVDLGVFAFSVGAEGGCGAGALFGGFDIRLFDHEYWPVSVSPVARWTVPWGPDSETPADQVPRRPSYEAAGSLRVGFVFAQYSYERNLGPQRVFEHPGGSLRAQSWHTFVLGFIVPFEKL